MELLRLNKQMATGRKETAKSLNAINKKSGTMTTKAGHKKKI